MLLREDTTILEARTLGIRKISPVKNKEILLSPSARGFHAITLLRGRNGYIYAGTTGGVYRSSDLGYTWSRMSGGMTKGADVYNIDVAPSGEVLVSTTGGVYRSTDNLQSWQWMSGTISNVCATAAIRLGRDSILCSTYDGPQLTTDNGVTWSNTKYDRLELFYSLIATPSGTIFGAADDDGYPRISTDRGKTWATIQSPAGKSARFAYHKPSRSFFGVAHSWGINRFNDRGDILDTWGSSKKPNTAHDVAFDSTGRIYFATSGGLYTAQNVNGPAGESGLTFNLSRVAVNGAGQVLAGDWDGNMYFRRTTTFEKCSQGLHGAPIRSIAVLPDQRVLVGTDWGLFVSKAPSTTVTAPELQQPVNASRPLRIGLILTWKNVQSARHYHLQVSRDSSFTDFLINDSTLTETRKDLPILGFAERYYWRVRSVLQAQRSPWSEAWSFTTLPDKPSAPQLLLPANNAEVAAPVATLEWRAAQYAEKYRLQVSTAASFATLLIDDTTLTGQTYEFGNLSAGVKYYWRVRGSNQIGASSWSDTWSFRATATDVAEAGAGGLRVYPNPATDELRVELPAWSGSGEAELSLVGLRGEVVRRRSVIAPISEVNFDLKGLPSGRYYLRAKSAGYTATVSVDIKR